MESITRQKESHNDPDMAIYTDDQICLMLQQRDARAIVGLSQRASRLEVILTRQFGLYIDREEMKEIVADTLIQAVRKGDRYDPHLSSLMRWLTVLGHYRTLRYLRTAKLFSSTTLDEVTNRMAARIELSPREPIEIPSAAMEKLLQRLSRRQADIVRWHFYEGATIEDIAERLNVKLVTVRSHKTRALQKLRTLMDGSSEGE